MSPRKVSNRANKYQKTTSCPRHALSLTHTHTHTCEANAPGLRSLACSLSLSHTPVRQMPQACALLLAHTLSLSLSLSHTHTHTHTHTCEANIYLLSKLSSYVTTFLQPLSSNTTALASRNILLKVFSTEAYIYTLSFTML